jgi:hypothetical protein
VLAKGYKLKVNAVSQDSHLRIENRVTTVAREEKKRDDRVKTVRADNVTAQQSLIYKKEFDVIWLIQHSRIGGSVDVKA